MSENPARILVVDDVPENVRLLEAVLDAHGYDVVSATDGHGALELALSAKPDLVLLDVMMPPPDGLEDGLEQAHVLGNVVDHEDPGVVIAHRPASSQ